MKYDKGAETHSVEVVSKLSDLEAKRAEIVQNLEKFRDLCKLLNDQFDQLNLYGFSSLCRDVGYAGKVDLKPAIQDVDSRLWDQALSMSGVRDVLSSEAEAELRKKYQPDSRQPEKVIPEFTAHDAQIVVDRIGKNLAGIAGSTIRRIFENMTNTKFARGNTWRSKGEKRSFGALKKSFRFSHFHGGYGMTEAQSKSPKFWLPSHSEERFALFNDLELVCRMLNHKEKLAWPNRIGDKMYEDHRKHHLVGRRAYANEFFTLLVYNNGNVQIEFTCMETLALLNKYGSDGRSLTVQEVA